MKAIQSFIKKIPLWHIFVWVIYLLIELYLYSNGFGNSSIRIALRLFFLILLTYVNIFYLFPKFYQGVNTLTYVKYLCLTVLLFSATYTYINFSLETHSCSSANCMGHSFSIAILLQSFISFLIFTLAFAMSHHVTNQKKKISELEINKKNIEIQLLQSQMDPHTLLNNMNTLYWKAMENDQDELCTMIGDVSDMLRYTLYETKQNYIEINKEIEFLEKLISFQSLRGKNRFNINFENRIVAQNFLVPPLIFAPLIENCFKHSVDTAAKVVIDVSLWDDDKFVYFKSSNNFNKKIANSITKNKGIGLNNLKKRLDLLYPNKQFLDINVFNNMFKVNLKIPKYYE